MKQLLHKTANKKLVSGITWSRTISVAFLLATGAQAAAQPVPSTPPVVSVMKLSMENVKVPTQLPGRVSAYNTAQIRPQVTGILKKRLFEEGSKVQEGQILYEIEDNIYQATLDAAKATYEKSKANVEVLAITAKRYAELIKTKSASQQDFDDAQAKLKVAQAELSLAKANMEAAQINVEHTRIKAPLSGRIGRSNLTQGALVTANQIQELTTIQQLDKVYVDITQPTASLVNLKRSFRADSPDVTEATTKVKLELGKDLFYAHEGEIKFSDVAVDPATSTVLLRAVVKNPEELLLPGMFVSAHIDSPSGQALLVPHKAVTRDPQGNSIVFLVDEKGIVQKKSFQTSVSVGNSWLVESGLEPNDQIITAGFQKIQEGQPATIQN